MKAEGRRRYLVLCVHPEAGRPEPRQVFEEVRRWVGRLHGEQGLSLSSLALASEDPLIVRCSSRYVDMVRAAVAALREVGGLACMVHVAKASGTLKRAMRAASASRRGAEAKLEGVVASRLGPGSR